LAFLLHRLAPLNASVDFPKHFRQPAQGSPIALIVCMRELRSDRGFSLIESLFACALLGTALLSIGHLSSGAIVLTADARNRTFATTLAVAKLEELRASIGPVDGADTVDSRGEPAGASTPRRFERRWSVVVVPPDAAILTVSVTPFPRGVAGREVRMTGGWTPVRR
jgi:type II secretory pathway pseudopilin PulG